MSDSGEDLCAALRAAVCSEEPTVVTYRRDPQTGHMELHTHRYTDEKEPTWDERLDMTAPDQESLF